MSDRLLFAEWPTLPIELKAGFEYGYFVLVVLAQQQFYCALLFADGGGKITRFRVCRRERVPVGGIVADGNGFLCETNGLTPVAEVLVFIGGHIVRPPI